MLNDIFINYINNYFLNNQYSNTAGETVILKIDYFIFELPQILNLLFVNKNTSLILNIMTKIFKLFFTSKDDEGSNMSTEDDFFKLKKSLYQNFHLLISKIPSNFFTKNIIDKFLFFLNEANFKDKNKENQEPLIKLDNKRHIIINTTSANSTWNEYHKSTEQFLVNLHKTFGEFISCNNNDFVFYVLNNLNKIFGIYPKIKNVEYKIEVLKSISLLPRYLLFNYNLFAENSDYNIFFYTFCQGLLKANNSILEEKEIMNVLCEIIKYDIGRDNIINYINSSFRDNESYFKKRIFILFLEIIFEKFSKNFINKYNIIDEICNKLLVNSSFLIYTQIIRLFLLHNISSKNITLCVSKINEDLVLKDKILKETVSEYLAKFSDGKKIVKSEEEAKTEKKKEDEEYEIDRLEKEILTKKENNDINSNTISNKKDSGKKSKKYKTFIYAINKSNSNFDNTIKKFEKERENICSAQDSSNYNKVNIKLKTVKRKKSLNSVSNSNIVQLNSVKNKQSNEMISLSASTKSTLTFGNGIVKKLRKNSNNYGSNHRKSINNIKIISSAKHVSSKNLEDNFIFKLNPIKGK